MQIPTFPKDPIDMPASPEAFHDEGIGKLADMTPRYIARPAVSERLQGIIIGLAISAVSIAGWLAAQTLVDRFWPVACDSVTGLGACAARMVGAA